MTKKLMSIGILIILMVNLFPIIGNGVQASSDIAIISSTNITASDAKKWAESKGATSTFISLADLYWAYASSCGGVNPAVAYAQAAVETGYGKFGGVLDASYKNPCGLKNSAGGGDYDPSAHKVFSSWDAGVQAQLDHLALYAGASGYPRNNTGDPRHFAYLKGKATTVLGLGGNWAPRSSYGSKVLNLYNEMEAIAGTTPSSYSPVVNNNNTQEINNSYIPNRGSSSVNIIKKITYDNIGSIDISDAMSSASNTLDVKGWALSKSGIKEIKIYVNNNYVKSADYGQARKDIAKQYGQYSEASNCGYSTSLDISDFPEGEITLKIVQVGNDNTEYSVEKKVFINKNGSMINIDAPNGEKGIKGNLMIISGWMLNKEEIKEINIYLDDKYIGKANYGVTRKDIGKLFSNYKNDNSGYSAIINLSQKGTGTKHLKIEQVTVSGIKSTVTKQIVIPEGLDDNEIVKNISILDDIMSLNSEAASENNKYC